MDGLLYINEQDAWKAYKVFLAEDKQGEFKNYAELLKPAKAKVQTAVNFPEEHGVRLPQRLSITLEPRELSLTFALVADSKDDFLSAYTIFLAKIREGSNGWVNLRVPELNKTYHLYYLSSDGYKQMTALSEGKVVALITLKFSEPNPSY